MVYIVGGTLCHQPIMRGHMTWGSPSTAKDSHLYPNIVIHLQDSNMGQSGVLSGKTLFGMVSLYVPIV